MLNGVPAAVEHKFGSPAVKCESKAPPDLLEEDKPARPVVDVEELGMLIGEFRGDQVGDDVESAGQLRVRAGDEAQGLPRVVGAVLGLEWPGRARLRVELCAKGPGFSVVGGAGLPLSFLDGEGEGGRCGLGMRCCEVSRCTLLPCRLVLPYNATIL